METRRFALLALLAVVVFFGYQTWEKDQLNAVEQGLPPAAASATSVPVPEAAAPAGSRASTGPAASGETTPAATAAPQPGAEAGGVVQVQTGTLTVDIGLTGGGLRRVVLEHYAYTKKEPDRKLALLTDRNASDKLPYFIFQTGVAGVQQPLTDDATRYTTPQRSYVLQAGSNALDVPLTYVDRQTGYTVHLNYHFERDSYVVHLSREVTNSGSSPLSAAPYARWVRNTVQAGIPQKFVRTYFGMGIYQQEGDSYKFKKHDLEDFRKDPFTDRQKGGWMAMLQQYFLAAVIPPAGEEVTYIGRPAGEGRYYTQMLGQTVSVAPGTSHRFETRLYIGPKIQGKLDSIAPGLALTEDYGLFTPIAKPLFWILSKLEQLTGNWGWSIVLLTLGIRGLFFKLSEKQYRSMAKMRKFGPRIKELRERHSGDREGLNKAMMDLYKKEKFNPLSGCWPVFLQFPVFIALYYVLIESVELRQASFFLWLQDLSAPDPFYILPVIYGISMWFQMRFSGQTATMEPTQQKLMNIMPIGLAVFFSMFPSGLVLYYVVSNLFTIVQQYVIVRRLDREGLGHR